MSFEVNAKGRTSNGEPISPAKLIFWKANETYDIIFASFQGLSVATAIYFHS
jgi:hypothetical protein